MGAYQILATIGTVLGLITTIAMTVAGWIVSGERAKRAKVETQLEDMQREFNAIRLELARDYVRSPQLEAILQQIRSEIGSVNDNVRTALGNIQKLEVQVARIGARHGEVNAGAAD